MLHSLPPELQIRIAVQLPIHSYHALSKCNRQLHDLLEQAPVKKEWLVRYMDGSTNDALVFAFRHKLADLVHALLASPSQAPPDRNGRPQSKLFELMLAFTQIVCHEVGPDECSTHQLKYTIVKTLLDKELEFQRQASPYLLPTQILPGGPQKFVTHSAGDDHLFAEQMAARILLESSLHKRMPPEVSAHELAVMALRWCSYYAEHWIVRYLLEEYGLQTNTIKCYSSWWLRMLREKRFELVRLLLKHGARVSEDRAQPLPPTTPPPAAEEDSDDDVQESLPVGSPMIVDSEGNALHPLRAMACEGRVDAVRVLLRHTPLYERSPTDLDTAYYNAMLSACMYRKLAVVRMLVEEEARDGRFVLERVDPYMECLMTAVSHGHGEVVQFLLGWLETCNVHSNTFPPLPTLLTCLRTAVRQGNTDIAEQLLCLPRILVKLPSLLQPEHPETEEDLLTTACRRPNIRMAQLLLDHGADVSHDNYAVVKMAAAFGHYRMVRFLMDVAEKQSAQLEALEDDGTGVGERVKRKRLRMFAKLRWKVLANCRAVWEMGATRFTLGSRRQRGDSSSSSSSSGGGDGSSSENGTSLSMLGLALGDLEYS